MIKFSNLKTKQKILIAVMSPLVLLPVLGAIAGVNINSIVERAGWVDHTQVVLREAQDVVASAVDMETGMRGYLLAGNDAFLDPYNNGQQQFSERIGVLQETVSDNPTQVARLTEAQQVINEWVANVTEPTIGFRREIGNSKTMNDIAAEVQQERGKVFFDGFRSQIATFIGREETLLGERTSAFESELNAAGDFVPSDAVRENAKWVAHTRDVIATANEILASAVDMETGMRGFLLAGHDEFLAPFTAGRARFDSLTEELKSTVSDNPAQVELLGEIQQTIHAWETEVTDPMIALRREIGDAPTMDNMADLVGEARGKVFFDKFRQIMADFQAEEAGLIDVRKEANEATVSMTFVIIGATIVIGLLAGGVLAWVIGGIIAGPLVRMTAAMRSIADGDTSVEVFGSERRDEIGSMAGAVEVFRQNAVERVRLEADQATKREADEKRTREIDTLIGDFDETSKLSLSTVSSAAEQMKTSATSMTSITDDAEHRSSSVASAAEEATANVQTVATAAEEMAASVEEISRQVAQSAEIAKGAVVSASETNAKVEGLAAASEKIGEVVDLINDIAAQTNLLALNATIEASRAGEAGKGFAVVASEVKSLATQTAKATEEIGAQISAIQSETRDAVESIQGIGKVIGEISDTSSAIASAVEEQGAATREIAENVQQAAQGTQDVSTNIVEVSRGVQETGSASQQVLTSATQLEDQSAELQSAVSSFLERVKAA